MRVRIAIENLTNVTSSIGIAVQMDANAAGNDRALMRGFRSDREASWREAEVPSTGMIGSGAFAPDSAGGRLRGNGVTTPDFFLAGQWESNGALGTALYGYVGREGRNIWDAAVFAQWDEKDIAPGNTREETTAIGIKKTQIVETRTTSFGKRFILYYPRRLLLATDSTTDVHIVFQDDNEMENSSLWDGK